ncbi:hypothetical protein HU200_019189 [Digitaria exilis]|uniref:WRKY domain-containing protein n=1 Tax=Digitaria exilis TaxID=1010633 RepID=A0A835KHU8_9POAL|nr:hypothetical protein HU200_019189 [Digitaria exilis]
MESSSYLGKRKLMSGNGAAAEGEPPAGSGFQAVVLGYDGADGGEPGAEARRVVGEMDFFKTEKRKEEEAAAGAAPGDLSINKDDLTINVRPNGRLNEENKQLRNLLSRVTTNYNSLQMHVFSLMQQRSNNHRGLGAPNHELNVDPEKKDQEGTTRQFISLGTAALSDEPLRSVGGADVRRGDCSASSPSNNTPVDYSPGKGNGGVAMNSKDVMPLQAFDHHQRGSSPEDPHHAAQGWLPNKVPKSLPAKGPDLAAPEAATMRKARVSVRARSEAAMISDGCQWRKYGQKMAKGNPCPRAYYRCTMATGCPVRKQVQRCAEDRTVVITTYEGNHNHPLPPAAMPMASATTSAASMLLSGSMPSSDGSLMAGSNFLARAVLPCSSNVATISASAPFPTVTLDLTQPPPPAPQQPPPPLPDHAQLQAALAGATRPVAPQLFGQKLYDPSKLSAAQAAPGITNTADAGDAAAVMASDPKFTAALAAAIKSYMGGSSSGAAGGSSGGDSSRDDKIGEQDS